MCRVSLKADDVVAAGAVRACLAALREATGTARDGDSVRAQLGLAAAGLVESYAAPIA